MCFLSLFFKKLYIYAPPYAYTTDLRQAEQKKNRLPVWETVQAACQLICIFPLNAPSLPLSASALAAEKASSGIPLSTVFL